MTLEAFADTIVPGEERRPQDQAVDLVSAEAGGSPAALPEAARLLNVHAEEYRRLHGLEPDDSVPPFVALPFEHRVALISQLVSPDHPEQSLWAGMVVSARTHRLRSAG